MSALTESDIKELKDLIVANQVETKKDLSDIKNELIDMKIRLSNIETRLEDWKPSIHKISDLTEKVGELKNWKQTGLVLITAIITSLFWIVRETRF